MKQFFKKFEPKVHNCMTFGHKLLMTYLILDNMLVSTEMLKMLRGIWK